MEDVERRVIGKVMRRLIPFLVLCYFVAYLDRVNVSFAKLHMNQALGFSEAAFGLGAGLFFIAYFLFEVPSNLFLERVGARLGSLASWCHGDSSRRRSPLSRQSPG
jgi:ACS family tartrate transporter-like MFS transporter